jgi:putative hemolysin
MRRVIGLVVILTLTGCQTLVNPVGPLRVSGNENTAVVSNIWKWTSDSAIFETAGGHCAKFGRTARYAAREKGRRIFDCVK